MIGVPFNGTTGTNNVTVSAEHKRYSYSQAVDKGIISAFLWSYDGTEWSYLAENDTLVPGKAYMIEATSDCKLEFSGA
jgi:cytochrome c2